MRSAPRPAAWSSVHPKIDGEWAGSGPGWSVAERVSWWSVWSGGGFEGDSAAEGVEWRTWLRFLWSSVEPELVASRPNEVWSWDITKLHGRATSSAATPMPFASPHRVLDAAHQTHPERFLRKPPEPPRPQATVWINRPEKKEEPTQ